MTIRELFRSSGLTAFESSQLIQFLTGWDRSQLPLYLDDALPENLAEEFQSLAARRRSGYPLQYLLGEWDFYGLTFHVGEGVLIPRSDTELLVEIGLKAVSNIPAPKVCDLCSGTGCIPVAMAAHLPPEASITAVELSNSALVYLKRNVEKHHCENIQIVQADAVNWQPDGLFDLIISNPPYLTFDEMRELQPEVAFEPEMALQAPEDGLYFYRVLSERCHEFLVPGGTLAFEVGYRQANSVAEIMERNEYHSVRKEKDLAGIERVVSGQL